MSIAVTQHTSAVARVARGINVAGLRELSTVNKSAILSLLFSLMFIAYFLVPHVGVAASIFQYNMFYVVALPLVAFSLAIVALRQINRTNERGIVLGYAALGITSLYLIVAMAIPVVLLGLYIAYTFIL